MKKTPLAADKKIVNNIEGTNMSIYSHDFEIELNQISVNGEIVFDHGQAAAFKSDAGEEMTIEQHGKLQKLFEALVDFHVNCASIDKIEITKKD